MLIVLVLGFVLIESIRSLASPVATALRYAATADLEASAGDDIFEMARLLNASASPGSRIALMGYYRYPLRADLLECGFSQAQVASFGTMGKELPAEAYLEGADYLVFDLATHKNAVPADFAGLPPWFRLEEIRKGARIWIYRLSGVPDDLPRRSKCVRDGRAWMVQSKAVSSGQKP
jgi:hypothetical protein